MCIRDSLNALPIPIGIRLAIVPIARRRPCAHYLLRVEAFGVRRVFILTFSHRARMPSTTLPRVSSRATGVGRANVDVILKKWYSQDSALQAKRTP